MIELRCPHCRRKLSDVSVSEYAFTFTSYCPGCAAIWAFTLLNGIVIDASCIRPPSRRLTVLDRST